MQAKTTETVWFLPGKPGNETDPDPEKAGMAPRFAMDIASGKTVPQRAKRSLPGSTISTICCLQKAFFDP